MLVFHAYGATGSQPSCAAWLIKCTSASWDFALTMSNWYAAGLAGGRTGAGSAPVKLAPQFEQNRALASTSALHLEQWPLSLVTDQFLRLNAEGLGEFADGSELRFNLERFETNDRRGTDRGGFC
jgi:hypothetical protein